MEDGHAVFGFVEEVVVEVLQPDGGVLGREVAEAHGEEVHVEHGDLGPGGEAGGKTKFWNEVSLCICSSVGADDIPSYHQPVPCPMSSPAAFLGISLSPSKASGTM